MQHIPHCACTVKAEAHFLGLHMCLHVSLENHSSSCCCVGKEAFCTTIKSNTPDYFNHNEHLISAEILLKYFIQASRSFLSSVNNQQMGNCPLKNN